MNQRSKFIRNNEFLISGNLEWDSEYFVQEVPIRNPVYLMLSAPLGVAAKGTGVKAIQLALSICKQVDIYGFTVDPGYVEWYVPLDLLTP